MNEQTLLLISSDLSVIKWLLIVFVSLFIFSILIVGVFIFVLSKDLSKDFSAKKNFEHKGRELLDKGELEQLIELAKIKLKEYPNHNYAIYFLAIGYYRSGNIHESYRLFNQLKELSPSWSEQYIDPYLGELEVKIKNNKPEILK